MYLTTKTHIKLNNKDNIDLSILYNLCYTSAKMYNTGLYAVRQHFFNTQNFLSYYQNYHQCKTNENYSLLLTDTGQQILRLVDRDFKSFFQLISLKKQGKYSNQIQLPHYKKSLMTCIIQGRSIRIKSNNTIRIGLTKEFREKYNLYIKHLTITIPKNLRSIKSFKEVRIIPLYNGKEFDIEFIYESNSIKQISNNANGYLSVDLGVDNLMACTIFSNNKSYQFIIDGKPIKSINCYYNKMTSKLKSAYSKNKSISSFNTKRFNKLQQGRNNRINDYFNKSVKYIIEQCFKYNVKTIIIGYNKDMKQDINIGKVNNQNFVSIPFYKLRSKLEYKCELHNICYFPQEESYTSKSSSIDLDIIPDYGNNIKTTFSGKRIHRGLYKSKNGLLLNADINGSINILRKYFKERKLNELSSDSVRAFVSMPVLKVNPFIQNV